MVFLKEGLLSTEVLLGICVRLKLHRAMLTVCLAVAHLIFYFLHSSDSRGWMEEVIQIRNMDGGF